MSRRRKFLLASVLALQNSSFIYPSCQKCFSRIILVSKRSNCPKCGSTGNAENATYRYKLSLKVAESNKLFVITVFGSCLDTFFGLSATGLHRYIQDPNKIPETVDSDTTQSLLTKAVETCFVGQSFIFGVTNFENQHGQGSDFSNFLQECPYRKREVSALVACHIVLPNPSASGFTVIDYFRQLLQTSNFRKLHYASQTPNSHLLALDHSDSDLSSICGPDSNSYFFESYGRENFSRFWQLSLELTSFVSQLTDNDGFSASEQSKAIGILHQSRKYISFAEITGSSSCHDPIQSSWSLASYMDKKSSAEKLVEEVALQASQLSATHSSHHEIRVTDSNLFPLKMPELLKSSNTESFHSAMGIKNRYSQCELLCHQHYNVDTPPSFQERSACFLPSSLILEERTGGSQDCDPEIWDDLPLSESLNKFLAVIENEIAITQTDDNIRKHHVDNDIDKFHADQSRLSETSQRITGDLHTPPVALRSSQATVKANSSKNNFLSDYEANPNSSVQKEPQPDNTADTVSICSNGRDVSEYFLPNAYLSTLFPSSKNLETTVTLKSTRTPSHRDKISLRPSTSASDYCLNIKHFNRCGEKSLSEMSEKLTTLSYRKYNDVSDIRTLENKQYYNLKNKQYYRYPKNQGESFTICRKLMYPLETLHSSPNISTNTLKEVPCGLINNNLTQSNSTGHEGSYDASADLFGDIDKEMDITTEIIEKSQYILSLAESHPAESDFSLRSPEKSSQPSQKLSLQSISVSRFPRICSPPPHFQSDSEHDFEDSQDFVPCSQSTPVAGFHQTRIHGMNRAFKKLSAFYSDFDANCKKKKISPEYDKRATPNCPKTIKTPIQRSRSPVIVDIAQPEALNHCPIAECLETDVDELVPPTTKKVFLSDMPGFQVTGLRKCLAAHNSPNEKELPRKKLKHVRQRTDKCVTNELNLNNMLTARVTKQKTPKYNCKSSGWIAKESILGLDSCSDVKCCLPFSENCPASVSEAKTAWSPELFS
ncbi:PREDICTED: nitric oxide-inducible gene protein [Galeopterus variegatus]|uniref:Nitric oxide-inducible gene protein n=1 Tax=Galeopterus variegatus TaxID=482537 RepID=A0ABM0QDL3_GALVR|nr:PREDICTED: nitric oxide-inducible gene protein [Galeopterus variegatus]